MSSPHRSFLSAGARPGLGKVWLSGLAAVLALGGCASVPPPTSMAPLWRDAAYAPPPKPLPSAHELFALSPAMRHFVEQDLARALPSRDPRLALVEALYRSPADGGHGLRLAYEASHTRTASEAFGARAGNCLSLVMMTAAFARHLNLAVSYQSVRTDEYYSRAGTLTLASGHVNLVLGGRGLRALPSRLEPEPLVVDFLPPSELRDQRSEPLTEATIVAMYFNNRAAELLADGQPDLAYWHAREALHHDPGFVHAVNTLGVIHQRSGQAAAAEAAFRHVLAQDGQAVAALTNLVALLRASGRTAEAEPLADRLLALQPVPPFHWLRLGREALSAGQARLAVDLLRRELRRQPEQDEVHFALAEAHLRLGDTARAQQHLLRAAEFSTRLADQHRYEAKLSHLRAALLPTRGPAPSLH